MKPQERTHLILGSHLPSPWKLILIAIADHMDEKDQNAWPGMARLALLTGYCPRELRKAIGAMEKGGIITRTTRGFSVPPFTAIHWGLLIAFTPETPRNHIPGGALHAGGGTTCQDPRHHMPVPPAPGASDPSPDPSPDPSRIPADFSSAEPPPDPVSPTPQKARESSRLRALSNLWCDEWSRVFGATYPARVEGEAILMNSWTGPRCEDWRARKRLDGLLPARPEHDGVDVLGQVRQIMRLQIEASNRKAFPLTFASFVAEYPRNLSRWQASEARKQEDYDGPGF